MNRCAQPDRYDRWFDRDEAAHEYELGVVRELLTDGGALS